MPNKNINMSKSQNLVQAVGDLFADASGVQYAAQISALTQAYISREDVSKSEILSAVEESNLLVLRILQIEKEYRSE